MILDFYRCADTVVSGLKGVSGDRKEKEKRERSSLGLFVGIPLSDRSLVELPMPFDKFEEDSLIHARKSPVNGACAFWAGYHRRDFGGMLSCVPQAEPDVLPVCGHDLPTDGTHFLPTAARRIVVLPSVVCSIEMQW